MRMQVLRPDARLVVLHTGRVVMSTANAVGDEPQEFSISRSRQKDADACWLAGAFNTTTGPVHWELLQKARAVDNQLFVATCSPARNPEASYQAWGHSTAVDPFGKASTAPPSLST